MQARMVTFILKHKLTKKSLSNIQANQIIYNLNITQEFQKIKFQTNSLGTSPSQSSSFPVNFIESEAEPPAYARYQHQQTFWWSEGQAGAGSSGSEAHQDPPPPYSAVVSSQMP